ncbi:branched-chain amino acid transporter permease [Umezawaea sp.]|uniref:branched-chain amino acid transporter permease n=1 Tax=Umezawaea sp. TaxID=1955258 RepID=UPI002ED45590
MPDHAYVWAAVGVSAAVTWLLRALPFAVLVPLRDSAVLAYLGPRMPAGAMLVLAVHTLRDTHQSSAPAVVVGLAVTAGLHLWRRNAVLSVLGGTAVHVVLLTALELSVR